MRKRWIAAAAALVAVAVVGVGAVMAQSEEGDGTSFLDRVAAKLGIDTPKLEQAVKDARTEEIDEAVANGDLTQEQADRLKEKVDELPADAPFGHGFGGFKGGGFAFGLICPGMSPAETQAKLAEFLGISEEQLRDELAADGATLATVAEAHGKGRDELKAFLEGEVKARLDEAVANEDITQKRADEALAQFQENLDDLIDRTPGAYGFGRGPGMPFHRAPDGEDDGATPEQSGTFERFFRS